MAFEEEARHGVPDWFVTFADMMTLLLCFFVMLVSVSEFRQNDRLHAMLNSMQRQFGRENATNSAISVPLLGDSSVSFGEPSQGRSLRKGLQADADAIHAPVGEHGVMLGIRQDHTSTIGGVIAFGENSVDMTDEARAALQMIAKEVAGKPHKLEVRGHTSRQPVNSAQGVRDHWDLAYNRCYNVMQYLIDQGIEPQRIRLGSAGAYEPVDEGLDPLDRERNARVEVLMWDERAPDPSEN